MEKTKYYNRLIINSGIADCEWNERVFLFHANQLGVIAFNNEAYSYAQCYRLNDDGYMGIAEDVLYENDFDELYYEADETDDKKIVEFFETLYDDEPKGFVKACWYNHDHYLRLSSQHGINTSYYYFDTDVEIIKPLDDILALGPFMGFERNPSFWEEALVNPGLGLAMQPNSKFVHDILDYYSNMYFILPDGSYNTNKTVVHYTREVLWEHGLKDVSGIQKLPDVTLYPSDYFAPIDFVTGHLKITKNTRTIHRYMASWKKQKNKSTKDYIKHYIPLFMLVAFNRIKNYKSWRWFR